VATRPRLEENLSLKVSREVFIKLQTEAELNKTTLSKVVRRIIDQHFENQSARIGTAVVEDAVRRVIEPHVDQLAGLITYSGLAAATSHNSP